MKPSIILIAEHFQGRLMPVTFELMGFAGELRKLVQMDIRMILLADRPQRLAEEAAGAAEVDIAAVQVPGLSAYNGEAYLHILKGLLHGAGASYVCVPHTSQGWDFAPGLAAALRAACITDVQAVEPDGERPCFVRALYGGKLAARVRPNTEPTVVTVRPGCFRPPARPISAGTVVVTEAAFPPGMMQAMRIRPPEAGDPGLSQARVVVAAGKGIGKKENLAMIHQLAQLFSKAAVAGSRTVCDLGWLSSRLQVGLTGATVAPDLYIACGISGASQHVAGMRGSGFVVAVNTDRNAAIFNESDVCVVEDLARFIPAFIKAAAAGGAPRAGGARGNCGTE
jgi:electron transfer flavoprotein alpha subunit